MAIANLPHSCLGLATVNFSPFLNQNLEIFRTRNFVNRKSRLVVPKSIVTCARNGGHSLFPYSPTETRNSKRSLTTTHARRNNTSQTQSPAPPTPLPTDPALNPAANARPAATGGEVLVTGTGLSKTYDGIQFLFNDLDISVSRGQKVGLLGANGSGKSTLLKVLGGVEVADKGTVQQRKGTRIGYLAQVSILQRNQMTSIHGHKYSFRFQFQDWVSHQHRFEYTYYKLHVTITYMCKHVYVCILALEYVCHVYTCT